MTSSMASKKQTQIHQYEFQISFERHNTPEPAVWEFLALINQGSIPAEDKQEIVK